MLEIIQKSKYFNSEWYKEEYPIVARDWHQSMEEHYLQYGGNENRNPGPCFDASVYKKKYCTGEYEGWNPLIHYEKIGKKQGIVPPPTSYQIIKKSKYFEKYWYKKTYIGDKEIDPIRHYLNTGWKEGYNPGSKFDGNQYLRCNLDVERANICPLLHFELVGKNEDREVPLHNKKKYSEKNVIERITQNAVIEYYTHINKKLLNEYKILVHLHLFYFEAWDEIKFYLNNLSIYSFDLCVTHSEDCTEKDREILKKIVEYKKDCIIYSMPNRGFDIGPFVEVIKRIDIDKYDIIIKLHSKGIHSKGKYIYNLYFKGKVWFEKLFRGTIGVYNTHFMIKKFFENPEIGMIAAKELIVDDPLFKKHLTTKWGTKLGININDNYQFVAGTCFAMRRDILSKVKQLNLSIEDFDKTTRGEFTLAHALERIFSCIVLEENKKIYGLYTFALSDIYRRVKAKRLSKYSTVQLLNDNRFVIDDEFFFRILDNREMLGYSLEKIPLKNIIRVWNGEKLSLKDCAPYKYLMGDETVYKEYCDYHRDMNLPLMTPDRYETLIKSIGESGFNEKSVIVINQDNVLLDGQHRACYLMYKYGEDYEANILKIIFKR